MKLLSYTELITERLIECINESIIYYSPELRRVFLKLSDKNTIAKELSEIEGKDVKPDTTFIDFDDKEGFLTFIKMDNALKKLKDKSISTSTIDDINNNRGGRGAGISDLIKSHDGLYGIFSKSRNPIKIGKLINQLFPGKFNDSEREEFVNLFKAKITSSDEKIELIEGNKIKFWYNSDNYLEIKGQLGGSCMRGGYDYFDIYTENKDVCKMLILTNDDDKLLGRALVWKIKSKSVDLDFEYFMDRQYTINDSDVIKFRGYADEKGWAWKTSNNHHSYYGVTYKEKEYNLTMKIDVIAKKHDYYPYLDTFRLYDPINGVLSNDVDDQSEYDGWYILEDTDGGYESVESGIYSEYEDRVIPEGDEVYSDAVGSYLTADYATIVENGNHRHHGWYPDEYDYIKYDNYNNYHIHIDDTTYCHDYDDYIDSETAVNVITALDTDNGDITDSSYYWNRDRDIVETPQESIWYEFLLYKYDWSDYDYISSNLITNDYNNEYILNMLKIEVYLVVDSEDIEYLRELDAEVLGIKIDKLFKRIVDKISYYKDIEKLLEKLYKGSVSLYNKINNDINNKGQLRMKFNKEDHESWKAEMLNKSRKLSEIIDDIESEGFLERDFKI